LARRGRPKPTKAPAPRRMTVRIDAIGSGGDGVARDGEQIIHTPLTAPGDIAVIDAEGGRGRIVELIEPSALRAEPTCRHFGDCGGCAFQHLNREAEQRWKRALVEAALARANVKTDVRAVVSAPAASRRRASFAVTRAGGVLRFGFNARRSSHIVSLASCDVLAPALEGRLADLRALAERFPATAFDLAVTLCDNGLDVNVVAKTVSVRRLSEAPGLATALHEAGVLRLSVNGQTALMLAEPIVSFDGVAVSPPPGAFLQASREGESSLIGLVRQACAGARRIADLFCGCGTFTLPLAKGASVSAFDSDGPAIVALQRAAADAQAGAHAINPTRAQTRDLFERPLSAKELKSFDAVVFDPPRAGASAQAAEIARSGVPTVIGVSCNPQTFARDASLLVAGGYRLVEVTPVDQFVYSPHVELVGVFATR